MSFAWKKAAAAVLAALVALGAAGCGSGEKGTARKDTLTFGCTNFADSMEPTENYFGWEVMRRAVGECLVKFDGKMNVTPCIAESWLVSDDKLSWTFKIRDIKFSNGNKVTGEAVKKSIERVFNKSARAKALFTPAEIVASGQEVVIRTTKPVATLPGILGDPLFIIVDVTEDGKRDFSKEGPVATGPYMIKSYSKTKTVLEPNPNYWNGNVPYKSVIFNTIYDPNTRAMALQNGEVDVALNIAPGDLALFKDKDKFNISTISSIRDVLVRLNQKEGRPLHDKRVREALISSLDRPTYCNVLLQGTFTPGGAMLPPSLDYDFDKIKDPNAYNVERAKQLLAEAGWKDTNGDGFVDKDGKNLELTYVFYSGRAELPLFAEATQADAQKAGIKINLKNVDYNILYDIGVKGDYDLLISNILTCQAGDPEVFLNMYWHSNDNGRFPENGSGYSSAVFDGLSDRLAREFDPGKRRQLIIEMQKTLLDDAATFVYGYPQTNMVSNKSVVNAHIQPCDYYWLTNEFIPAE